MKTILSAAIGAMLALSVMEAGAQNKIAERKIELTIEQQSLADALNEWAKQTGLQLVSSSSEMMNTTVAPQIKGAYTAQGALEELLKGTTLTYEWVSERAVAIREKSPVVPAALRKSDGRERVEVPRLQLAKLEAQEERSRAAGNDAPGRREVARPERKEDPELEEIVVTGSRLARPPAGAVPVDILDAVALERTGANTVAQALSVLPEVSMQSTSSPLQNGRGSSSIQLRGLPAGTALVLLNGRRLPESPINSSEGIANLNLLPLAAVERIEVLPAGSSAVHGGDALAGVVNIVLKKNIDGLMLDARYGVADGYDEQQISAGWGMASERVSLSMLASYSENSELQGTERSITANNDYSRFGGPDLTVSNASPANIYSLNGQNLPGLSSRFAGVPSGTNGTGLTPAHFSATAGTLNLNSSRFAAYAQRPEMTQYSGFISTNVQLTPAVDAFAELLYSRYEPKPYLTNPIVSGRTGNVRIPATNPFNPFGVDLGVEYIFHGVRFCQCVEQEYYQTLVGLDGTADRWHWEVSARLARGRDEANEGPILNSAQLNAALADTDPTTSLNLFADRTWSPQELARFSTIRRGDFASDQNTLDAFARGPLFTVPAGEISGVIGAEYSKSDLDYNYVSLANVFSGDRTAYAVFAEVRAPLLGRGEEGEELLVASGAVRFDHYSDFGSRTSPQIGLEWQPLSTLKIRGAYSTAFKPPTLFNLFAPAASFPDVPIVDSRRGGESYGINLDQGGNPDLDPLTARTTSIGFSATLPAAEGLQFDLTHWTTKIDNFASIIDYQTMVDQEGLFPAEVIRAAPTAEDVAAGVPGRVETVRNVFVNFGTFNLAGVDLSVRWRASTRHGAFSPWLSATNTYRYDAALIPGAPDEDRVSRANLGGYAPRWKGVAGLEWDTNAFVSSLVGRYVGSYRDHDSIDRSLGNFWLLDVNFRLDIGRVLPWTRRSSTSSHLSVGASNVLDKLPEYSSFSLTGYDPTQYDLMGRLVYGRLSVAF